MKPISAKKKPGLNYTQYQTLDIALVDTRCSIFKFLLIPDIYMFANFFLISLYLKILFCEGYKGKVRRGYSEKNTKLCRNLKKVSPLKILLLNGGCLHAGASMEGK